MWYGLMFVEDSVFEVPGPSRHHHEEEVGICLVPNKWPMIHPHRPTILQLPMETTTTIITTTTIHEEVKHHSNSLSRIAHSHSHKRHETRACPHRIPGTLIEHRRNRNNGRNPLVLSLCSRGMWNLQCKQMPVPPRKLKVHGQPWHLPTGAIQGLLDPRQ